jgi:hypothetical protein
MSRLDRLESMGNAETVLMTQHTGDFIEFTGLFGNKDLTDTEPNTALNRA